MTRLRSLLHTRLVTWFAIDLRALAAFRIALAVLVGIDIVSRSFLLTANYTDAGAHPRSAALTHYAVGDLPSLYMLGGSTLWAGALFVAAGAAALALGLGWQTRAATFASWILADSLHARHDLLTDGGDHLLRCLLFWSVFAPLGARWSLDARRRGPPAGAFAYSPASAALLLQMGCVFLVTGVTKSGPEWFDGTAILYALDREWWIQPFGAWVLAHPALAQLLTPAVRWYEILGALALFAPVATGSVRCFAVLGFWGLLAGLGLGLRLNLFPWITGAGLLLFLPAAVWDRLERGLPRRLRPRAAGTPGALVRARSPARWLLDGAVVALLAIILWMAAGQVNAALRPPHVLGRVGGYLHLWQSWLMYAPSPRHIDFTLEHRGRFQSRALVKLDDAEGGNGWRVVHRAWRDYRFQYYLQKLLLPHWQPAADAYARWLCRQWNVDRSPDEQLESVTVTAVVRPIALPGEEPANLMRRTLSSAACRPRP